MVLTPSADTKSAQFLTTSINTGSTGDCDPTRPIFNISQGGESHADTDEATDSAGAGANGQRFAGLGSAPVAQSRTLVFDESQTTNQFFMAVLGQPEKVFDPNASPAITAVQGTVEQWKVENRTTENHEFHVHQTHFLVESQNDFEINGQRPAPAIIGQYLDTLELLGWDGNPGHPFPSVTLRIDFRGPDIGDFVFHCHILGHEDLGMMNIIQVVPHESVKNNHLPSSTAAAGQIVAAPAVATGSAPHAMLMTDHAGQEAH